MIGLELSQDNKFAAAYTNNNTTILLNTLIGEFFIINSPLGKEETVQGLILLDTNLIIYGQQSWGIFDMKGNLVRKEKHDMKGQIMTMQMVETLENYSIITWSGIQRTKHVFANLQRKGPVQSSGRPQLNDHEPEANP